MLKFLLLNFTRGFIPLHATTVFYVAVSSGRRRTDVEWYLSQIEIKQSLSAHSSSVLRILCHPFWLIRGCLWGAGLWLQCLIPGTGSTTAQRFEMHISPIITTTGRVRGTMTFVNAGMVFRSIMSSHSIYSCLAVPKSTIVFWFISNYEFRRLIYENHVWK